jgi:circadian clock protein KaiC
MPVAARKLGSEEGRERCATGIDALDSILNGGIPRGNTILITGSCGTGKTTLSIEFLIHGAISGEPGLFLSVTEAHEKLLANMMPYDFMRRDLLDAGKLTFIDMPVLYHKLGMEKSEFTLEEVELLTDSIAKLAAEMKIKRLVLDSVTSVCFQLKSEEKIRDFVLKLGKGLADHGVTSLLVSEILPSDMRYSTYGVEEAIADGIILMGNYERRGDLLRTLQVVKMRGTSHSRAKYVLDITPLGILMVPLLKGGGGNST